MKLLDRLKQELRNIYHEVTSRATPIAKHVKYDTQYVCQFALPAHAELSLKKELAPINDPFWKETGASSPERYAQWAFTMCGMASVAMALGFF